MSVHYNVKFDLISNDDSGEIVVAEITVSLQAESQIEAATKGVVRVFKTIPPAKPENLRLKKVSSS